MRSRLLILLSLAPVLAPAPAAAARIAVVRDGRGVWSVDTRGGSPRRLAAGPVLQAGVSPSGRLAVVRGSRLLVDGRPVAALAGPVAGSRLAWSPHGTRVAVAVRRGVASIPYHAHGARRLLFGPGARDPVGAPNGRRIAFVRDGDLRVSGLGGSRATRSLLADVPGAPTGVRGPTYGGGSRRLLFGAEGALWAYGLDGPSLVRVAPAGLPDVVDGAYSPSGRAIAFVVATGGPRDGLYVARPDGTRSRLLLRAHRLRSPMWRPMSAR